MSTPNKKVKSNSSSRPAPARSTPTTMTNPNAPPPPPPPRPQDGFSPAPTSSQNVPYASFAASNPNGMQPGESMKHDAFTEWQLSGGNTHAVRCEEKRNTKNRKSREGKANLAAERAHGFVAADAAVKRALAAQGDVEEKRAVTKAIKSKKPSGTAVAKKRKAEEEPEEAEEQENQDGQEDEDDDLEAALWREFAKG